MTIPSGEVDHGHRRAFFANWLSDPLNVAAIAPSGRMLARRMAVGIGAGHTVVELGAGTGTLTTEILKAGVKARNLHLVERNAAFADILRRRFPGAHVHHAEAGDLADVIPVRDIDSVVSGLPILWFERSKKRAILKAAFEVLRSGGFMQQFTYFGKPPVGSRLLRELGLSATLVGLAPLNLPPAFVYRFERRG